MKLNFIALLSFLFFIFLLIGVSSNLPSSFTTPRTCSDTWGASCNASGDGGIDDAFGTCDGTEPGDDSGHYIVEVYTNASSFFPGDPINATCEIFGDVYSSYDENYYLFYYNGSDWMQIANWTDSVDDGDAVTNYSAVFKVNNSIGEHRIRCSMCLYGNVYGNDPFCSDDGCFGMTENDDLNFTVAEYPKYDFWNLTNSTGADASNKTFNRTNSTGDTIYLNVSAHWTNNIAYAFLEHNGTGTLTNYTISSITANWTNVTLNLSNAYRFNRKNITITAIYANNSYGLYNKTYPPLTFNLNPGSDPDITKYWFNHLGTDTNNTNLYTNLTIYANVSDDVGIYAVTANLTYPSSISIVLNLSGNPDPVKQTWNYGFETVNFPLNETGNYTVSWIKVNDTGDQVANLTQNLTNGNTLNLPFSSASSRTRRHPCSSLLP